MKPESEIEMGAIVITVIISLAFFSPEIYSYVRSVEPRYYFDACDVSTKYYDTGIIGAQEKTVYVPDYDAKINVDFLKDKFNVDENVVFKIEITNTGIQNFSKPYFYVEIFGPDERIQTVAPCLVPTGVSSSGVNIFKDMRCPNNIYDQCTNLNKLKEWQKSAECRSDEFQFYSNERCFSRGDIMSGDNTFFRFNPDKAGIWKLFVILYDEDYYNRKTGNIVSSSASEYQSAAIESTSAIINVTSESPVDINPFNIVRWIVGFTFAGLTYFKYGKGWYVMIKKFYMGRKNEITSFIIGTILLVFLGLFLFFIALNQFT